MNISFQQGAHPLVAANWDKKKTLKENYKALGLLSSLNGYAGGQVADTSCMPTSVLDSENNTPKLDSLEIEWKSIEQLDEEKRKRKEKSLAEESGESSTISPLLFAPLEPEIILDTRITTLGTNLSLRAPPPSQPTIQPEDLPQVIKQMKQESLNVRRIPRFQSEQETLVFGQLVEKWGADNYDAMARDVKLNVYQLSAGQLKKKLTRAFKMAAAVETNDQ
jgi:nucleolar protein 16